jgi:hypothetical protein
MLKRLVRFVVTKMKNNIEFIIVEDELEGMFNKLSIHPKHVDKVLQIGNSETTSSEIIDEDIKYLKDEDLNYKLLLEIAAETTSKLSEKQEHLQQCKWTDGESNKVIPPVKVEMTTKIEDLETLKSILENKDAQRGLIALYTQSQSECTRNGACGMEVGMSREKDQGAVLKHFLGNRINLDIDNSLPEDYIIGNSKISAKHSGSKVGSAVKAKWTSADVSVKEAIEKMINAEDSYYPHLLLTYLDTHSKKITIICISSEENKNIIKTLKNEAFTIPKGNSRGIEYSRKAMNQLLKKIYFKIEIYDVDLKSGINPTERRIQLLKSMGI